MEVLDAVLVDPFFAPTSTDLIDGLVAEYRKTRQEIEDLARIIAGDASRVIHYFITGNSGDRRLSDSLAVERMFHLSGAVAALNADYWQRALSLTDVLDLMPQKRRDEWYAQLRNPQGVKARRLNKWELGAGDAQREWDVDPLPDFTEETVRHTLHVFLTSRARFLAERVDGIFRALSGTHVTNRPEGFGKRMIISRVIDSYGSDNWSVIGVINDLRNVIARFMGRPEHKLNATMPVIQIAKARSGEWLELDGGTLRLRVYKGAGTAHLEVHPDMAWRLNAILASLYPMAIPPQHRQRQKTAKSYPLRSHFLPLDVTSELGGMRQARRRVEPTFPERYEDIPNALAFDSYSSGPARIEAERVLAAMGGVKVGSHWQFSYPPRMVLDEVVCGGCIPDVQSHQFYPTPVSLVEKVQALAEVEEGHIWLEPSAGTGALAEGLAKAGGQCIEISALHARVLEAKGFNVLQADFLEWAAQAAAVYDRVLMNPPFSEGRWQAHLQAAAGLVKAGGRLVAILPASARSAALPPGWRVESHGPFEDAFAGTGVRVIIVVAEAPAAAGKGARCE